MKTCLIVDDSRVDRMHTRRLVEALGLSVDEADGGKKALEYCREEMPDCILLDWEMPEMNGVTFLEHLRSMDRGEDVYVIMCSSHSGPEYVGHAYVSGASSYIAKPIIPGNLEKALQEGHLIPYAGGN